VRFSIPVAVLLTIVLAAPVPALAWGAVGHRIINNVAARSLPDTLPAFVRTPDAIAEITLLGPEADRLRSGGKMYGADFDPAHFLDLGDDDMVAGVLPLAQLPVSREAYDSAIRKGNAIDGRAPDEYVAGYLPYAIADGYQQVEEDFAIWRFDSYGETHAASPADRASFSTDRKLREILTVRDIGYFGHFVADASQPLHVTVHFNGWGNYPNPNNYTLSKQIHSKFESAFVSQHESADSVLPLIGPYAPSTVAIIPRVAAYLTATNSHVGDVYKLEGAGAFDAATPPAVSFTADRLADGARMLRDLIADAYNDAANTKVGYPGVTVKDVESGTVAPVPYSLFKG
jgi:hypothetical protein